MKYRIAHTTRYTYDGAVPIGYNRVYLTPRNTAQQQCLRSHLEIDPVPAVFGHRGHDYYGNEIVSFTIQEQHRVLEVTARSEVWLTPHTPPPAEDTLPWEAVVESLQCPANPLDRAACRFRYPSESIAVSRALRSFAKPSFPTGAPVLVGARNLMERIYREFAYDPSATTVTTPVEETLHKKRGVCQDFAHLQIGCLRALGLAARYVSGYVAPKHADTGATFVGAQASHAWLSLYVPTLGWVDLDPTNNVLPTVEHITVAWGRNYGEVSPMRGVILGGGGQRLEVAVDVCPIAG